MTRIKIQIGAAYFWNGEQYLLVGWVSLEIGLFKKIGSDIRTEIPICEISNKEDLERIDSTALPDELSGPAKEKLELIRPLLGDHTTEDVRIIANQCGKALSTVYRWIKKYLLRQTLTALITINHRGRGQSRLDPRVEKIIQREIQNKYLKRKWRIKKTHKLIKNLCLNAGFAIPHYNTVRSRILALDPATVVKYHKGLKAWKGLYQQKYGHYVSRYPLDVVQIDHLELNILIVDSVYRLPITKRIWLTVAIDIFSRVVVGYCFSRKRPNTLSVGLTMTSCILPKGYILNKYHIPGKWEVCGLMDSISLDNALEFHSLALQKGCDDNDIDILWREVEKPEYGGHVERLAKTIKEEVRSWEGTTFNNPDDKGDYDPKSKAIYTFEEIEDRFVDFISCTYNVDYHEGIMTTPLQKYHEGIEGDGDTLGHGWPDMPDNPETLLVAFLPGIRRTVQRDGVTWDRLTYQCKELTEFLYKNKKGAKNPKYLIKRDPRDIRIIYFYPDDEQGVFIAVPLANPCPKVIVLDDWLGYVREKRRRGKDAVNNIKLLEAFYRQEEKEEAARRKTQAARRKSKVSTKAAATDKNQENKTVKALNVPPDKVKLLEEDDYDR